ncbi:alpha/beta hydrolase [Photobacterium sanguinicancri]|uniref:Alpha/beta hydrolase n=1 Tax=Photobacterium sanguinicancri TaxID=875932 RepID=A0AAW7Y211_9GAMM|nr:alpha/beta hydrolase [Photobacterium sanguinicancri]KXI22579.1 lipase [Photobacterium sanguinicancri]MDO6542439.1 alpha/beta hydrolase [Photobacterium sanguinicancri]OZS43691.1 lipase [Photobacterium sanguinicancri]
MDSWRNRAFNKLLYRVMRQRLARCNSTLEMRELILNIDNFGALISTPKGLDVTPTKFANVGCDWVDMPKSSGNKIILYFHGGGFCFYSPNIHNAFVGRLAQQTKSRGLMINYSLAPEKPYPAALDECYAVYQALLVKGYLPQNILFAGDSAGGNLALATLLRLRDMKMRMPAGIVLLSPVTDMAVTGESAFVKSKDDPFFDLSSLLLMRNNYLGNNNPCDPDISPFYAELNGLPPCFVTAGTEELLMDDAIRLAEKMGEAGGDVTLNIVKGVPHVYPLFYQLNEAKEAIKLISQFMNDSLKKSDGVTKKAS